MSEKNNPACAQVTDLQVDTYHGTTARLQIIGSEGLADLVTAIRENLLVEIRVLPRQTVPQEQPQ